MTIALDQLHVGQEIRVHTWSGATLHGVITAIEEDIKNGRPGVDYDAYGLGPRWCYLDQIFSRHSNS